MEEEKINRVYLETLTFADLTSLADEYGIDVPENLDRRILIGEILDLLDESKKVDENPIVLNTDPNDEETQLLPGNYNETQVSCILRNPIWAFVFWNISESDEAMLRELDNCSLMLRICSLSSPDELKPAEAFEIQISRKSFEQYVLLPRGKEFIRIELVYVAGNAGKVLAFSPVVEIQQASKYINDMQPGKTQTFSKIIELSGMQKILAEHYKNYRHSF
ncbi:MAG: DUF4912 domain-containing protein [Treponema sp.]|nr:DUF4912 domain-containing protein [Treponema sp.]